MIPAVLWALVAVSLAETPLPSYRDALVREAWRDANALLEAGLPEKAAERALSFQAAVVEDGSLMYLVGLSQRVQGQVDAAVASYERALALDPTLAEAWYDLGEIHLSRGELDAAEASFSEVSRRVVAGPHAFLGPQRLAEVAAHRRDAVGFEANLREALSRGFSFQSVAGLPNWKAFYADPALRDVVEKMVTVYGTPEVLDSLR